MHINVPRQGAYEPCQLEKLKAQWLWKRFVNWLQVYGLWHQESLTPPQTTTTPSNLQTLPAYLIQSMTFSFFAYGTPLIDCGSQFLWICRINLPKWLNMNQKMASDNRSLYFCDFVWFFILFYKPFAAKCPPAGFFLPAENTSPDFLNMSFHELVHFHWFGDRSRPAI